MEQVEDRGWELLQQLLVIGNRAGLDERADLRGEVLADAGNGKALRRGQVRQPFSEMRRGFRGVAVCPNLERVLSLDLEEIADFRQDTGDGEVVHRPPQAVTRLSTRRPSGSMVKSSRRAPRSWRA